MGPAGYHSDVANPFERAVRAVDRWQQRHRLVAFPIAVIKKFGDDQAGNLVALLTYYAFLATFPLLLVLVSVLGFALRNDPHLQQRILNSALTEFPIIGDQLRHSVTSLNRSGVSLGIGLAGSALGARGLANATQTTLNTLWAVPRRDRPGFPYNLLRSIALLLLLGLGAVLTAAIGAVSGGGGHLRLAVLVLAIAASAVVYSGLFLLAFRLATARDVPTRQFLPGAVLAGVAWEALLSLGGLIVAHYVRHAQAVYGFFGIVLGMLAWFGLQATVTVYAIEADVVRADRLWPRSITQPPLTGADKRFYTSRAHAEVRRPEQRITIDYSPSADHPPGQPPGPGPDARDTPPRTAADPGTPQPGAPTPAAPPPAAAARPAPPLTAPSPAAPPRGTPTPEVPRSTASPPPAPSRHTAARGR